MREELYSEGKEPEGGWISVKELLPKIGQECLFLTKDGVKFVGTYVAHKLGKDLDYLKDWENSEYTHWLPLPLPPISI